MPTIYVEDKSKLPKRVENDFYPTPIELCRKVAAKLPIVYPGITLDPGAGTGVWGKAIKEIFPNTDLWGVEIRPVPDQDVYNVWIYGDFLKVELETNHFNLIIGNPPYKYAEEFLDKSLELCTDKGHIVFLLKLSFLESIGRYSKYYSIGLNPKEVWVSPRRVSFTGNRKSNGDAYGIFIWYKGYKGLTTLKWLDWSYDGK